MTDDKLTGKPAHVKTIKADLTAALKTLRSRIANRNRMNLEDALLAGETLLTIRETCEQGDWLPFLEEVCIPSQRASEWMRLAGSTDPGVRECDSITEALERLAENYGLNGDGELEPGAESGGSPTTGTDSAPPPATTPQDEDSYENHEPPKEYMRCRPCRVSGAKVRCKDCKALNPPGAVDPLQVPKSGAVAEKPGVQGNGQTSTPSTPTPTAKATPSVNGHAVFDLKAVNSHVGAVVRECDKLARFAGWVKPAGKGVISVDDAAPEVLKVRMKSTELLEAVKEMQAEAKKRKADNDGYGQE
jgi:hypothetical protein